MKEYSLSYIEDCSTDDRELSGGRYDTNYYSTDKSGRRWDIGIYFNTVIISDKETKPEVMLDLYVRLNFDQIDLSGEDGDAVEYGSAGYSTPSGYTADFDFRDLNIEYDFLDIDTEKPMDIAVAADLLGVSKESLNAFILDLAEERYEQHEDWIIEAAVDNVNNSYDDYYESFDNTFEALNSLNEVFNYKEEEILSDEEVKEITAKIAELEPQYKEASNNCMAKRDELRAAGMSGRKIYETPEYKKLEEIETAIGRQLSPLKEKLRRHNDIIKYRTAGDQIATEEDGDRVICRSWEIEVDVEVDVYAEADEYPSGGNYATDSISGSSTPARYGKIRRGSIEFDVTKEGVADFLRKKVEEVTVKDLMDFDKNGFEEYLAETGDAAEQAQEEAEEAVEKGDYEYDDVDWEDDSGY